MNKTIRKTDQNITLQATALYTVTHMIETQQ